MGYRKLNNPYACTPCDTRANACLCCDTGFEQGYVDLILEDCDGAPSRQLVLFDRHTSGATLPCDVDARYPATAPCGVFWGLFTVGETGCTGDMGEAWTGAAGMLIWCDGEDPAMPYKGEAYCYDDFTNCYVYQGDLNLSNFDCLCSGPTFYVGLPNMGCCCPEDAATCCTCDDLPSSGTVSDGIGGSLPLSKTCVSGETTMAYTVVSALDTLCGELIVSGNVDCVDGVLTLTLNGTPITLTWDGDCGAVVATGSWNGCTMTVAI